MKVFILFIYLGLYSMFITGQNTQTIDSLKNSITLEKNDSLVMDAYNRLRREYYYSDQKVAHEYAIKYLEYAQKIDDSTHIGIAYYYIGNANFQLNKFSDALDNYLISSEYFQNLGAITRLPSVYSSIGSVYQKQGEEDLALEYFDKVIELSKANDDLRRQAIGQMNAASIYGDYKNEEEKAIQLLNEAIQNIDTYMLRKPGKNNLVYKYMAQCNIANFYKKSQKYDEAKEAYELLLETIDSVSYTNLFYVAYGGLGQVDLELGDIKNALPKLEKAYLKFTEGNFQENLYDVMPDLIDAYEMEGQPDKALGIFKKYNVLKDSINDVERNKRLNDAMQQYESEKKERVIAQQELVIEKREKQRRRILYALISSGVLFIGVYIFFRKRLKYQKTIASQQVLLQEKALKEIEQKNLLSSMNSMIEGQESERFRIAQDLHDGLGGLLSTVKAHFTVFKECTPDQDMEGIRNKMAQLIDESCIEVRRISHNMMPHSLSISGLTGTLEDMIAYLNQQGYEATLEVRNVPDLTKNKEVMIYRLVQEIFSNIKKHAQANTILLQLIGAQDEVHLMIEDDGVGFEYEYAFAKAGLGIKSINSRVEILNGNIHWDSKLGEGTCVTINIPVV